MAAEDPEDLRRVIDASLKKWGLEPWSFGCGAAEKGWRLKQQKSQAFPHVDRGFRQPKNGEL